MYKKVKDQIAKQIRPDLGFANINRTKGFVYSSDQFNIATTYENAINFVWNKAWYIVWRAAPTRDGIRSLIVPAFFKTNYAMQYPDAQFLVDYYDFLDVYRRNIANIPKHHKEIEAGVNGSFTDSNLLHKENAIYVMNIPAFINSTNVPFRSTISMSIASGIIGVGCSVFVIEKTKPGAYPLTYHVIYSSQRNGLVNSWVHFDVPVGKYGSQIYITIYNHDLTIIESLRDKLTSNSTSTDNFFKIAVDLKNKKRIPAGQQFNPLIPPSWDANSPIISTVDATTGNTINTLKFESPSFNSWDSIEVYRRTTYDSLIMDEHFDNNLIPNSIVVDTSVSSLFTNGTLFFIGGTSESIRGALSSYTNKVSNPDFSNYTGFTLDDWTIVNDSASFCTSYSYSGDGVFNGNCIKFYNSSVNHSDGDGDVNYYIETNDYLTLDSSDIVSFWYKIYEGSSTGRLKMMYYSSDDGTLYSTVSSVTYSLDVTNPTGWHQYKNTFIVDHTSDPNTLTLPSDAPYAKIRFYSIYEDSASSTYLLDGFHVGKNDSDYLFHTSSGTKTIVNLETRFEKPRNITTKFNCYFKSTTQSIVYSTAYASSIYGNPQYVDTNWSNWAQYDYGIRFADSATNYLENSNFVSDGRGWASSDGFDYSWISEDSSTYRVRPLFGTGYALFEGDGLANASLSQDTSGVGMVGDTTWSFAIWARSDFSNQRLELYLEDGPGSTASAFFYLSSAYAKYIITTAFSNGGDTVTAGIRVSSGNSWEIEICGTQLEASDYISDYNYIDTSTGSTRIHQGIKYNNIRYLSDELITDSDDRDFSAASNWINNNILFYDALGDLSLLASDADEYCYLSSTYYNGGTALTPGSYYAFEYDVVFREEHGWKLQAGGTGEVLCLIDTSNTNAIQVIQTTERETALWIVSVGNLSFADFDNFSLKEIDFGVNYDYGTIRMWITPTVHVEQGVDQYIFSCTSRGTNMDLYWNQASAWFTYKQIVNGATSVATVPGHFNEGDHIHLVVTWDTSLCYLYVNNYMSSSIPNRATVNPHSFYLGCDTTQSNSFNGIISDFRLDHSTWNFNDVGQDYHGNKILYTNGTSLSIYKDQHIGSKVPSGDELEMEFIDDIGLLNNTEYTYIFRVVDDQGVLSPASTAKTVTTPRKPFEDLHRNKVINSSFEIIDPITGFPSYWTENPSRTQSSNSDNYFINKKSVNLEDFQSYVYSDKMDGTDTVQARSFSFHAKNYDLVSDWGCSLLSYNAKLVQLTNDVYGYTDMTGSSVLGADGTMWSKWSTTLPAIESSASFDGISYWRLAIVNIDSGARDIFIDAVQFEYGSVSPYKESYYIESANIPRGVVGGTNIAPGSLVGSHLYLSELVVSSATTDASRIVIGTEDSALSYSILSHNHFKWHAPNLDSGAGWNYTKHIESGEAIYGDLVTFSQEYYNWTGSSNPAPIVIITPKRTLSYSTVSGYENDSQTIEIVLSTVGSTGFIANAYLHAGDIGYFNQSITYMWRDSASYGDVMQITSIDEEEWGATTIAAVGEMGSTNNTGTFHYFLEVYYTTEPIDDVYIKLFATSAVFIGTSQAGWVYLGGRTHSDPGVISQFFDININHEAFSRCTSFAILIDYYAKFPTDGTVSINPTYLNYSSANITTIKTDSEIGTFTWISMDGGIVG